MRERGSEGARERVDSWRYCRRLQIGGYVSSPVICIGQWHCHCRLNRLALVSDRCSSSCWHDVVSSLPPSLTHTHALTHTLRGSGTHLFKCSSSCWHDVVSSLPPSLTHTHALTHTLRGSGTNLFKCSSSCWHDVVSSPLTL